VSYRHPEVAHAGVAKFPPIRSLAHVETDTGWSRAAGESTGRWRTILDRAKLSGRASVPVANGQRPDVADHADLADRADLVEARSAAVPVPRPGPGTIEWRAAPTPGTNDQLIAAIRRDLGGSRVLAFANPKGGVHKTTATVLAAATIGSVRGRGVVAWDDNELRGTLGLRAGSARHARTIRHLVTELVEVESHTGYELSARLDDFLRHASDGSYDVLAGEEDPRFARRLDPHTVRRVLELMRRTHDVICVDTGNNVESANWQTVMQASDQLVITSVPREDAAFSADWMLDILEESGLSDLVANAVTLLSLPTPRPAPMINDIIRHFSTRTRAVAVVPYDPVLEMGASIEFSAVHPATRQAWLEAASVILAPFIT
jgi:MinD-like ATPase involved in chromosome partitioning or flagellar assembly